jgi:NitT/TauT family transport system ATP-binding protein
VIRDLHAARQITVVLVTHDLREAVFLADRVFVMSARPGRVLLERRVDFARPRDLDLTFTAAFQAVVQELRERIVRARG